MARTKLIMGVNDLATVNPKLAKEWYQEYNDDLTPLMVTAGSNKRSGGNVKRGIFGRRLSMTETMVIDAHIAMLIESED